MEPSAAQSSFEFHKSLRVKQAKAANWYAGSKRHLWLILAVVGLAGGGYLLWQHQQVGNFALAAGLLLGMAWLWGSWYLQQIPGADLRQLHAPVALDQALSVDVLRLLKWPASPSQLWQQLSAHWQWQFLMVRFGLDPVVIAKQLPNEGPMERIWQTAFEISLRSGLDSIGVSALSVALVANATGSQTYLASRQLSLEDLLNGILWQKRLEAIMRKLQQKSAYGGLGRDWTAGFTPLLNQFASNLSAEVEAGGISHLNFHLHDGPAGNVLTALAQPTKNSLALVGETGSGKTTLVYTLADQLLRGQDAPPPLRYHKIMGLNASVLLSQVHGRGELEGLVLHLLGEAAHAKNIILFLDDAQLFFSDDTGGVNLANILLPVLQRGAVRMIAAMRPGDWQKLVATNGDLAAIFNQQVLPEPTRDEVLNVMEDQVLAIEARSHTTATYQAVQEAYRLAERYIHEQAFPGKGITVLTGAANFAQNGLVTPASVQTSLENSLGIKVSAAAAPEKEQLLNLEEQLHQRMINQNYAVKVVSDALRRARAGVRNPNRPVGSFLFLGPTGVGKTELTKALAAVYFGGEQQVIRVDMSEYVRAEDTARLLEPSGQSANNFLTQIRRQPFSVVLLDEVEKAHPDILNLLLQLLDEGRLTDMAGREASFRDAIIVATSNAGADVIRAHIEKGESLEQFSDAFVNQLINSQQFRPELINRFDEVVLFRPLNPAELSQVVDLLIAEVNKTLEPQKVQVALTSDATKWMVDQGYDPRLGARPMRRMVQRTVENVLAKRLLSSQVTPGATITLDVSDLQTAEGSEAAQPAAQPPQPAAPAS